MVYAEFSATNRSFYSWEMDWKAVPFAERLESRIANLPASDRINRLCSADCYVHVVPRLTVFIPSATIPSDS